MTLRSSIVSDASTVFCNADDFAESVIYTPVSGSPRTISAVVIRDGAGTYPQDGDHDAERFEVHVANDATLGVSSDELVKGQDTLTFTKRIADASASRPQKPTAQTIVRLISHDEGMCVFECH